MGPVVDVHTHMYPPAYVALLTQRTTVPYIHRPSDPAAAPRLILLPSYDDASVSPAQRGRPIDASYSSVDAKLAFMDQHCIAASILSLANPWLDFLPAHEGAAAARATNDDFARMCAAHPERLFFFATLPLSAPVPDIVAEIRRAKSECGARGVIIGTSGLGKGLDDAALDPVWAALAEAQLPAFIHPHYGLPGEVYGPRAGESGHVLPLALGFPMETTIAFARMFLARVFDRHRDLRVLLAHGGGALPFLASRLESCVQHEREFVGASAGAKKPEADIWAVLKRNVYLDGVVYSAVGLRAAVEAVGPDRVLWGSDHPFFPPVSEAQKRAEVWESVRTNVDAVQQAFAGDEAGAAGVLGENAIRSFGLSGVGRRAHESA